MTDKPLSRSTMDDLRRQYAERLRTRTAAILNVIREAESAPLSPARRAELHNHAHSLAGSGATFGYPEISNGGKLLEDALDAGIDENGYLPLARSLVAICRSIYATQAAPAIVKPEPAHTSKPTIALVDDDAAVHDLIRGIFRGEFNIHVTADGNDGLEMIRSRKPDLVLLDGTMLGMRGLKILETLQQDAATKPIPVVMLTAHNQSSYVSQAIGAGASGYIVKPLDPDAAANRIRGFLKAAAPASPAK